MKGNAAIKVTKCMSRKARLVDGINNLVEQGLLSGVQSVQYELLYYKNHYPTEVIKVIYPGGAFCIRNNTGNSEGETLRTIASLAYGGYYSEVQWYKDTLENPDWTLVKMEDILEMEPEEI